MMNNLKRKLRSRRGASMILAMVFMLFCAFVGGSVLASATANAYRVAQLAEEQDYLLERSAALLLSDQMKLNEGEYLRLRIVDEERSTQNVRILDGGGFKKEGAPAISRVITCDLETNTVLTDLQRVMVETAVQRYLYTNPPYYIGEGDAKQLLMPGIPLCTGFSSNNFVNYLKIPETGSEEPALNGNIAVEVSIPGLTVDGYSATYSCGKGDDAYTFVIGFGEDGQMKLTCDAFKGINVLENVVMPPVDNGSNVTQQVTSTYKTTTISWSDPFVEKGGMA